MKIYTHKCNALWPVSVNNIYDTSPCVHVSLHLFFLCYSVILSRFFVFSTFLCFAYSHFPVFSCPLSLQGRQYFYTDYIGESLDTQTLWSKPELRDIITIHPIKDPSHVYSLHLFYRTLDYEELFFKKQSVERSLSSLCEALPNDLVPPSFLEEDCVVPFGSSHLYDKYSKPVKRTHKHHQKKRF